ncbi:MAG: gamma carbonic anhydrase family protein [Pseudomonadota bacterium]|jgi:carbonic anhydrase/acetyltransferase-like protein (isoleucine patch superfamily)
MPITFFKKSIPSIASTAFIAPDAWVIGAVTIGERSSVFFNTVVRGDIQPITIGRETNLQEHVLVHSSHGMSPVVIGDRVTVGHRAIIHGCSIGSNSLIGMGATILDDAVIGENCIIGAHALVTKGSVIPPGSMVIGTPGKVLRSLSAEELANLLDSARNYAQLASEYREMLKAVQPPAPAVD